MSADLPKDPPAGKDRTEYSAANAVTPLQPVASDATRNSQPPSTPKTDALEAEQEPTWWSTSDNKRSDGPYHLSQLRELAASGKLQAGHMVKQKTWPAWRPAYSALPELFVIAGYQLTGLLGQGGMGLVYKATDPTLKRQVALKVIRGQGIDAETKVRFRIEAESVARLRHEGIVQIYAFGEYQDQPYFAMEYLEGGSLASRIAEFRVPALAPLPQLRRGLGFLFRPLDPQPGKDVEGRTWSGAEVRERAEKTAGLVKSLALAVHHAHERAIVHRDLKPANVLLAACGVAGSEAPATPQACIPKIADFGLAKRLDTDSGQSRSGAVMGTPSYMAPEQALAKLEEIGPRTDVWALGAILYELLTGRPPFKAANPQQTMLEVINGAPVPPCKENATAPRDLETICLKCLRKEPEGRYASARELADDLDNFIEHRPLKARPVSRLERLRLWKRRNPMLARIVAGSTVAASFLAVLVLFFWLQWRGTEAKRREAREEALLSHPAEARDALTQLRQLRTAPGQADVWPALESQAGRYAQSREKFDAGVRDLGGPAGRLLPLLSAVNWDGHERDIRDEVTSWLTTLRLRQGRGIDLPAGLDPDVPLTVAIRSGPGAVEGLAVLSPGSRTVFVLDADGKVQRRLDIPEEIARRAKTVSKKEQRSLSARHSTTDTDVAPSRLAYKDAGRLEYQVRDQLVVWDLTTGEKTQEKLPLYRFPQPFAGQFNTASIQYTASVNDDRATVTVRRWTADSRPVVVWRAAGGDPAGGGESVEEIVFGVDGRSLFVLTNSRLAVIDAATYATDAVVLGETRSSRSRHLIPCQGGAALLEQKREAVGSARLVFWHASLPQPAMRVLHHDAGARAFAVDSRGGEPLVAVGTADHRVRVWRGLQPQWDAGIPYLGADEDRVPARGRSSGQRLPAGATTFSRGLRHSGPKDGPGARRFVTSERVAAPQPYGSWAFLPGKENQLFIRRLKSRENEGPGTVTELYALGAGRESSRTHLLRSGDRGACRRERGRASGSDYRPA